MKRQSNHSKIPWIQFKEEIARILEIKISYDGHAKKIINSITETRRNSILNWIAKCKEGICIPEPCKDNQLAFIYKSNDNRIRGILTKKTNSYFIELFLDKHKYYDRKKRYLGI